MAVIVNLDTGRDKQPDALERLTHLVRDDLDRVNELIVQNMSYWNGRPTVDWMFATAYADDAAWNDAFWKHPKFNELLKAARSETDDKKRASMAPTLA